MSDEGSMAAANSGGSPEPPGAVSFSAIVGAASSANSPDRVAASRDSLSELHKALVIATEEQEKATIEAVKAKYAVQEIIKNGPIPQQLQHRYIITVREHNLAVKKRRRMEKEYQEAGGEISEAEEPYEVFPDVQDLSVDASNDIGDTQRPNDRTAPPNQEGGNHDGSGRRHESPRAQGKAVASKSKERTDLPFNKDWSWACGDVVVKGPDELAEYKSARRTNKKLMDLHTLGYRIVVDALRKKDKGKKMPEETSKKETANSVKAADVLVKIQREYADVAKDFEDRDYSTFFTKFYGVQYDWQMVSVRAVKAAFDGFHPFPEEYVPKAALSHKYRFPDGKKMVLRLKTKTGFEPQYSLRNSTHRPEAGLGVFAERKFYKGSVISFYAGQPVWVAPIEGGNLPVEKFVRREIQKAGFPWHTGDHIIGIRDLQGRYYAVNSQPWLASEVLVDSPAVPDSAPDLGKSASGASDPSSALPVGTSAPIVKRDAQDRPGGAADRTCTTTPDIEARRFSNVFESAAKDGAGEAKADGVTIDDAGISIIDASRHREGSDHGSDESKEIVEGTHDEVKKAEAREKEEQKAKWRASSRSFPFLGAHFIQKVGIDYPRGTEEYDDDIGGYNAVLHEDGTVLAYRPIDPDEEIILRCHAMLLKSEVENLIHNKADEVVLEAAGLRAGGEKERPNIDSRKSAGKVQQRTKNKKAASKARARPKYPRPAKVAAKTNIASSKHTEGMTAAQVHAYNKMLADNPPPQATSEELDKILATVATTVKALLREKDPRSSAPEDDESEGFSDEENQGSDSDYEVGRPKAAGEGAKRYSPDAFIGLSDSSHDQDGDEELQVDTENDTANVDSENDEDHDSSDGSSSRSHDAKGCVKREPRLASSSSGPRGDLSSGPAAKHPPLPRAGSSSDSSTKKRKRQSSNSVSFKKSKAP